MAKTPASGTRIESIDSARGLTVLLMIFVNTVAPFTVIPAWSKHAPGFGFTYVDAIAPAFMFIMGLSLDISFTRRLEAGAWPTVRHFLKRFALLFLFGSLGTLLIYLTERGAIEWIIFQNLAIAGLAVLPFMFLRKGWIRSLLAMLAMLAYGAVEALALAPLLGSGSAIPDFARAVTYLFAQSIGLSTLVLFGAGVSKRIREGRVLSTALPCGLALTIAGFALWPSIPPYRGLANLSYLLLGLGFGNLNLAAFHCLHKVHPGEIPVLAAFGKNSLVMFMVSSVLYKLLYLFTPADSKPIAVALGALGIELACFILAEILRRRRIFIKL
jgi:predicted acyltransferase